MGNKIDAQELSNELAKWHVAGSPAFEAFRERFGLPQPVVVKQTMIITLEIPVENMDPMGDTYTMGRDKVREILDQKPLNRERLASRITSKIETVEIVERKA